MCEGLEHLQSKRVLHRDIKSDNILVAVVNDMYHPMLIDSGKAIRLSKTDVLDFLHARRIEKETSTYSTRNSSWSATLFYFGHVFTWASHGRCQLQGQKKVCFWKDKDNNKRCGKLFGQCVKK